MEEGKRLTVKEAIEREKSLSEYVNYILRLVALVALIGLSIKENAKTESLVTASINWIAIATFIGLAGLMFVRFLHMNDTICDVLIAKLYRQKWINEPLKRPIYFVLFILLAGYPVIASRFLLTAIFAALNAKP